MSRRPRGVGTGEEASPLGDAVATIYPSGAELALCLIALIIYGIGANYADTALELVNTVGPLLLSAALGVGLYRLLQRGREALWLPLFWYRVAFISYFGVGALVPLYVNEASREMIDSFYAFYPAEMLRLNVLLVAFHLLVLLFSIMTAGTVAAIASRGPHGGRVGRAAAIEPSTFGLAAFGTIFTIVGVGINLLLVLPATLGLINLSAFGQLAQLNALSLIGYFLLTLWALHNRSRWLWAVILLAMLEACLGLLQMTKFVTLFPLLMVGLGFVYHRPTARRFGLFVGLILVLFIGLAPIVGYTRVAAGNFYNGAASPDEVVEIYKSYFSDETLIDRSETQDGWMRLSYVNAGTFAMTQFDQGFPGNSMRYIFIIWIPRAIYPDKPYITDVSREFTYAVNGNYNSSASPGIPAEAYWAMGWVGVVLVALLLGVVFTLWSLYSYIVLRREAWHLFFVVLYGMRTASRMDGAIVADIVGPIGLVVAFHFGSAMLNRFLVRRAKLITMTRQSRQLSVRNV